MTPPIMPMASKRRAVDFQLIQDESTRQREARFYILHLTGHILTLKESYSLLISPGDNLKLSNFENYRHSILEFAETTYYLSDDDRLLIFSSEIEYLREITGLFLEKEAQLSLNDYRLQTLLSNAVAFNLSHTQSITFSNILQQNQNRVKSTKFICSRCFPPKTYDTAGDLIDHQQKRNHRNIGNNRRHKKGSSKSTLQAIHEGITRPIINGSIRGLYSHENEPIKDVTTDLG